MNKYTVTLRHKTSSYCTDKLSFVVKENLNILSELNVSLEWNTLKGHDCALADQAYTNKERPIRETVAILHHFGQVLVDPTSPVVIL